MSGFPPLPSGPRGRYPAVRAAYRVLQSAHSSVSGLFDAVDVLDRERRAGNKTTAGRMSQVEIDVVRSAMVMTSAGLDASMKRLVTDAGRVLATIDDVPARTVYLEYLEAELKKDRPTRGLIEAVQSRTATDDLLEMYLSAKTKASFQGTGDLTTRVRKVLGIPNKAVSDADVDQLKKFFTDRNKISHDMDLVKPASDSTKRMPRNLGEVSVECARVFDLAVKLILGTAAAFDEVKTHQTAAEKKRTAEQRRAEQPTGAETSTELRDKEASGGKK